MKCIRKMILTMMLCLAVCLPAQAAVCKELKEPDQKYNEKTGEFEEVILYETVDLNGDHKPDTIGRDQNWLYINSKKIKKVADTNSIALVDLFQDRYVEIVIQGNMVYRYDGDKLNFCGKIPACPSSYGAMKGKSILSTMPGEIVDANGKGTITVNSNLSIPGLKTSDFLDWCSFSPKYKVTLKKSKFKVKMVEKEYPITAKKGKMKTPKQWVAYKKASVKKNKQVGVFSKGTNCVPDRIKITSKYTYIRFKFNGKKKGWVIFKTSQMAF